MSELLPIVTSLGNPIVTVFDVPVVSISFEVPAIVSVSPKDALSLPESPANVIDEFDKLEFGIFEIVVELASIVPRLIVTVFDVTAVEILVPPATVNVSPSDALSLPESPAKVIELDERYVEISIVSPD